MRATVVASLILAAAVACAPAGTDTAARDQGRTYTEWLYDREFDKLWERFSPEMKETFASAADLAEFAGQTADDLGTETGDPHEVVEAEDSLLVYTRRAAFDRSGEQVLVQWTLTREGLVTGFVVRPAVAATPS